MICDYQSKNFIQGNCTIPAFLPISLQSHHGLIMPTTLPYRPQDAPMEFRRAEVMVPIVGISGDRTLRIGLIGENVGSRGRRA